MEYLKAKKIREEWGGKPCDHLMVEREFYGDTFTLDWVCPQCGAEFNMLEMLELKENNEKKRKASA